MTDATPRRRVVLLGATGSVGRQACDIIERFPDRFELVGAVVRRDLDGLQQLVRQHHLTQVAVVDPDPGVQLPVGWKRGPEGACEVAALDCDVVCVAIPGAAALEPALAAVEAGRDIALATKEVLVVAGDLVRARASITGSRLFAVDSEHSAVWQCLRGEDPSSVARLILTASGGPFRRLSLQQLAQVTVEQALNHPNWDMGPKVTVDSATMMNKGLEVIEAHHLFDIPYGRIQVVIHPSSVVHSMVEFVDGATMAQLGRPDMRIPIALALTGGERLTGVCEPADLPVESPLEFQPVDPLRFPSVDLARSAGERGGCLPAVLNAANEVAVEAFLQGRLAFNRIVPLVSQSLEAYPAGGLATLDDLRAADDWAREYASAHLTELTRA